MRDQKSCINLARTIHEMSGLDLIKYNYPESIPQIELPCLPCWSIDNRLSPIDFVAQFVDWIVDGRISGKFQFPEFRHGKQIRLQPDPMTPVSCRAGLAYLLARAVGIAIDQSRFGFVMQEDSALMD